MRTSCASVSNRRATGSAARRCSPSSGSVRGSTGLTDGCERSPPRHARARIRHRPRRDGRIVRGSGEIEAKLAGGRRARSGRLRRHGRGDDDVRGGTEEAPSGSSSSSRPGKPTWTRRSRSGNRRGSTASARTSSTLRRARSKEWSAGSKPFARPNLLRIRPDGRPGHHPAAQDRAALLGPERQGGSSGSQSR